MEAGGRLSRGKRESAGIILACLVIAIRQVKLGMPDVTVILNSYNQAEYLAEAIGSVLDQTLQDLELLIIDNGSTDESPAIIRKHASGDSRIRTLLHRHNAPITVRFNEGVDAASSPFVCFLYSDDILLPTKLERQVRLFSEVPADYGVVYGPARGLNARTGEEWVHGTIASSGWVFDAMLRRHFSGLIDMVSPLTRVECLRMHRFYEDTFAEGEAVFFRIALTHRFHFDKEPVAVLRDHGRNAGKAVRRNAEITMLVLDRLATHPDLPPGGEHSVRRFKAQLLRSYAWQGARLGETAEWIRACLVMAARLEPRTLLSPRFIGAAAIISLPRFARRWVNRLGFAVRRSPGNAVMVRGMGGADSGFGGGV